ncbi:MAG TPA: hypothetical protein PLU43_11705, partial [Lachnospiraceae bacterium]|nr:hypothetical protein [Lachnospiraceae bacterium]
TGGIAGQSIGVIRYSTNYGVVGYEHVGYNVGGIAGRQSGYIYECNNEGIIYGRKDVGGITGQAEPYIVVDFSKDVVYQLSENINKLHDLIDQTLQDAGSESDTISNRLSVLQSFADKALDDTSYLSDKTVEWTDGVIAAANEAVGRAEYIMDEASKDDGLLDQSEDAAENVKSAAGKLSEVVDDLDIYQYMSDAEKEQYDRDKSSLESATSEHAAYAEDAYNAYEDYYLDEIRSSEDKYKDPSLSVNEIDLRPVVSGNTVTDWTWNSSNTYQNYMDVEDWVHHTASDGDKTFPDPDTGEQNTLDNELLADTQSAMESNAATVESDAASYADSQYLTSHGSVYTTDIESYVDGMAGIVLAHTGEMSDSAKEDAGSAASYAKSASENLKSASGEAKDIVSTVAGESDIE